MGYGEYIYPYHYYHPGYDEDGESENKLKNINNIKIDLVCPASCRPRPAKTARNKLVNINHITITVDGHKTKHKSW